MKQLLLLITGLTAAMPGLSVENENTSESVLEEIVVTADYRQSAINDLSTSVSVLSADKILGRGARHLDEILSMASNVNFSSGASRARFYQVRGIGERGQFAEPLNSSVGLIIDNVDFSGAGTAGTLFDVQQVEILKGPQGTLYGANALAGLINVKTREPSSSSEYRLQLEAANFDSSSVGVVLSGPLGSDDLLYRLAGQQSRSDGFNDNDYLGKTTNERDEVTVRGKLRWHVSEDVQVDLHASLIDVDNGYDLFALDNGRDTISDEPGQDAQKSDILGGQLTWSGFDPWYMEVILGRADSDITYGYDEDWTHVGYHPWEYSSTDYYVRDRETTNAEIRLISNDVSPILGGTTDWVFGIYALNQEMDLKRIYTWLDGDFLSDHQIDRYAIYGQTDTELSDAWSVTAGLRYERYEADYADSDGVQFSPDEDLVGGRIVVDYEMDKGHHYYLSASRGYKSGGFNTDGSLDADLREFDSESLWNYETGLKSRWYDGSLQSQIALFYMARDDVQISSSVVRVREDGSSEFIDYVGNAAEGTNYGLEVEANWAVADDLALFGTLGILKSEYQDFVNSSGDDLDGRDQPHAPEYQFYIGGNWHLSERLSLRVELEGKDEFFFSDSHNEESEAYELLHASVTYETETWRASLWGRNLTDEDYFVRGFFFGNDPAKGYVDEGYTQLGEPLRVGMTFTMDL
jgi:outer membrane receptor protein involved in Fe transport